jgi:tRNA threonylcarbamoyladenosine biosynthesis protein TsaB
MNFLSIDCSIDIGTLFLKIENKTFSKNLQSQKSSNDLLMKQILDFFNENNLKFDDISKIFVNQGPGNFSGLRASLAVAQGISLSKNLSLFGYDTFTWSISKFFSKKKNIYSIIKFRRKYFIKSFNSNFQNSLKIEETTKDEIILKLSDKFKVIPKNICKYFDSEILELSNLNIVDLDHNMLEFLQIKGLLNEGLIKPLYLN